MLLLLLLLSEYLNYNVVAVNYADCTICITIVDSGTCVVSVSVTSTSVIGNYADVTLYEELSGYCCENYLFSGLTSNVGNVIMM